MQRAHVGQPPSAVRRAKLAAFSRRQQQPVELRSTRTAEGGCPHKVLGELMDWRQLWEICSAPDNVPIVGLIPLLVFYIYLACKQAHANDELIAQLEADPAMAKTHHRKTWPFKPGLAEGSSRLAVPAAHRISRGHYHHHHSDGLVDHTERAPRRARQSQSDHESGESALVFPRACRKCWCISIRGSPAWSCRR